MYILNTLNCFLSMVQDIKKTNIKSLWAEYIKQYAKVPSKCSGKYVKSIKILQNTILSHWNF